MKITQDVREYAKTHGVSEDEAIAVGMEEKVKEFEATGAEIYHQA
jgi:phosphomethylpyrimidine synthase